jgi:outer membrane protein TolC
LSERISIKLLAITVLLGGWATATFAETSLNRQQALDRAFERNPDLQAAAERVGQAEAQVAQATAAFYPTITGRVGYSYSNDPSMAFSYIVAQRRFNNGHFGSINNPGFVENFRPELITRWSLFNGGQDYYRRKAAELGAEAAELQRAALRNGLAAAVTSAYYAALAAPRQVEVARRSILAVDSELEHARLMHKEGVLLKSDVLSLEVRRSQAREIELRTLNAVELTRSGLKTLLGMGAAETVELRESALLTTEPAGEFAKRLTEALAQRPEMQAASRQVEMRQKEVRIAQGAHLPRVNAYASYGINERSPEFDFNRDNLTMGVNAEVDFFTGGAVSAKVTEARRKLAEAEALREKTRLEIEDEVRQAHANLNEAQQRQEVAEAAKAAAEEALRLVHEQYRGGAATVTRYLEAEADRAASDMRAVTAGYDLQVASANLKKAVGYWK